MNEAIYSQMFQLEQTHWWFCAKHQIVEDLLRRYLHAEGASRPRIADLGCGCGLILQQLSNRYDAIGLDGSPLAVELSSRRNVQVVPGGLPGDVPLPKNSFDAVLMLDVLEHIDEDKASAQAAAALLKPGGILLCTVPAYQWLWGRHDESHHHKRRYTRSQFGQLFQQPDLKLELLSHFNTWLFPPIALVRLIQRITSQKESHSDLSIPPMPINRTLQSIFASERFLLGRLPLPFGLSIAAVARKTG